MKMGHINQPQPRMAYSVKEACAIIGVGKNTIFALFNQGRLSRVKIGKRTLVLAHELKTLLDQAR